MDPVSRLLSEREGSPPLLAPFAIAAFILHAALAGGIFFAARSGSSRPAHLPVVAVKFVRAPAKLRPSKPKTADQGPPKAAEPKPTKIPEAKPTAKPVPVPVATSIPPKTASDDAMQAIDSTPAPTRKAAAAGSGSGQTRGLSLGSGDNSKGDSPGVPADFQFTYYINRMLSLIESRWYKPPVAAGTRARVGFRILKNGRVENVRLEETSGVPTFDRAVLRALYAANPLPPLPPAYLKPSLTVHLTFSE